MGLYSYHSYNILDAVRRARGRNVNVHILQDGSQRNQRSSYDLERVPGVLYNACNGQPGNTACISNQNSALQHNKYILFSQTRDWNNTLHSNVVWYGTANLTPETGARSFNDTMTVYGDFDLYDKFLTKVWNHQWAQSPRWADFYEGDFTGARGRFRSTGSRVEVRSSPNQEDGQAGDLVASELNKVVVADGCEIQVMHNNFTRTDVADKLAAMRRGGCRIWVIVNTYSQAVRDTLTNAGIAMRRRDHLHQKTLTIGSSNGNGGRYRAADGTYYHHTVITGSHNLSFSARKLNDELLVTVPGNWDLFREYRQHGIRAWVGIGATSLNGIEYPSNI